MFIVVESHLIISSQLHLQFYPSNNPRILQKIMYIACKLFIHMLGVVTHSMLFILCSPNLRGGRSVLTRHLSSGLHMLYVNMMEL
jgi:hypothetical protein